MKTLYLLPLFILIGCIPINEEQRIANLKQEVLDTEAEFAQMVKDEGLKEAFNYYAADHAVIERDGKLIMGRQAIRNAYDQMSQDSTNSLTWQVDYVDVALAGDMAYTYGEYIFSFYDSSGRRQEERGVFHTVWRKQQSGEWKYVWD